MSTVIDAPAIGVRTETDSLGKVDVPGDKLWGAQTQRSLEHFSIGHDLIPREMITAYATLKKGAANANHNGARLDDDKYRLILETCDEWRELSTARASDIGPSLSAVRRNSHSRLVVNLWA